MRFIAELRQGKVFAFGQNCFLCDGELQIL